MNNTLLLSLAISLACASASAAVEAPREKTEAKTQAPTGKLTPARRWPITAAWDKTIFVSKTSATLQTGPMSLLPRGSALLDRVTQALQELGCDQVRGTTGWFCYPRRAVAELEPPKDGKATWDFALMDQKLEGFFKATAGHSVLLTFCTIPQWMFITEKPVPYPDDPDQVAWNYRQGTEFRDPTLKEVADYFARVTSWYTKGGFTDEYGKFHRSDHSYTIDYYGVLNEPDIEHKMTPETYTRVYDAIVAAVRKVQPRMKFVGLSLAYPSRQPRYFEYFLNPKNHKAGIPIDLISYHFYATPGGDEGPEVQQYTVFAQADGFLNTVRYVELIRQRLAPKTMTYLEELGAIPAGDLAVPRQPIPDSWWNLSGALYAYLYGNLAALGIDLAGASQLIGFPGQFPGVSMVDWNTGQPNARYWVLKLIHDNFGPGDKLVETTSSTPCVYAQGFISRNGSRKLLLVNKRDRSFDLAIPGGAGAEVAYVDQSTGFQPPATGRLQGDRISLQGLAVTVVNLPR